MSPITSIYDHLTLTIQQQPPPPPTTTTIKHSNSFNSTSSPSNSESLHIYMRENPVPLNNYEQSKRRYTVTNISLPEPIRYYPSTDNAMIKRSSTTHNMSTYEQKTPKVSHTSSTLDFRPLITNGRRKFGPIPSSSSMIIIKKKSPISMVYNQEKPLNYTIVDNSISSYSSSSSSINNGTVSLPIQVTKTYINNIQHPHHSNSTINQGQNIYHYVQQNNALDKSTTTTRKSIPRSFSSSFAGEGHKYRSTILMDSNVLRLIRRYDPSSSTTTGNIPRQTLDKTRGVWNTISSKTESPQPSDSPPFLSKRSLTTAYEDEILPNKQQTTPRLQRQQAIQEFDPEPPSVSTPPPPPVVPSLRPILKYASSRSRSEFTVQPHQTEPLTIEIPPPPPPSALLNESPASYQPLITTGTKRVCSALSKSEWDLRLQQEQIPNRPPSPISNLVQQEKESYRPSSSTMNRSKSSFTINQTNENDDYDEISAPILPTGSCVEKLKQLFVTKSSSSDLINQQHRKDSLDSSLNRNSPSQSSQPTRPITKPQTIIQEVTPIFKKPILRSQKTLDNPESVNRGNNNNNSSMPSLDLSYDAYRYRRLNEQESAPVRSKNIAKVEPYLMNTKIIRPQYQSISSSSAAQPPRETIVGPSKTSINLNSMGNTPVNSSTSSSSAGSLGAIIHQSDFLMPNSNYPKPISNNSSSSYPAPPMFPAESFSHGSLHQLPPANIPSYNGHPIDLLPPPLRNNNNNNISQEKYPSSIQANFQSNTRTYSPSLNNDNNYPIPANSYYYRPMQTHGRQLSELPIPSTINEQQNEFLNDQQQQQQASRRRFHRRKQMKRSKSVDSYQDPTGFMYSNIDNDLNQPSRQQRSTSREYFDAQEHVASSSSSSSSSLTADIERVNRAALLRYKSLDSITYNNRKTNLSSRNNNNRKGFSKAQTFDYDSDDSVCGIPKPRKLCTSSKNTSRAADGRLLDSSLPERDQRENNRSISTQPIGSSGASTGITNSVRKNETINEQIYSPVIEATPSTTKTIVEKREGEQRNDLAESQFYARTSNTPSSIRRDLNQQKDTTNDLKKVIPTNIREEKKVIQTKELHIDEPIIDTNFSRISRPLSNTVVINPFERLRPMGVQPRSEESSLQVYDQPPAPPPQPINQNEISIKSPDKLIITDLIDETNDSSTSTTNRSVHLPVEKQRGLSEVIRKRNSKTKVEDYKRSIQKPSTLDEQQQQPLPISKSEQDSIILPDNSPSPPIDTAQKYFDVPIKTEEKRAQMSIERLNLLLTKDEQEQGVVGENSTLTDKRSLFETKTKDIQIGGTLPRTKPSKTEEPLPVTKKYTNDNQRSQKEDSNQQNPTYDDDISKLTFKEKMTLFNKTKPANLTPTSSLKINRNRLTQPITAEEVQAAANLTPASSTKQLSDEPDEIENLMSVSQRLEQFKKTGEKNDVKSTRKTPTLKYNAKKTNTDQENRAKTIDIVRLKTDSAVKPKDTNKTNGATTTKSDKTVVSVIKSDTVSVLKPDDHLDEFFADTTKNLNDESTVQLNTDDLNRIAENTTRLQSQAARVRPPRRQQPGAKNPLRQIQATIPTEYEYTEVHTNLSEQEIRRLKRAQIAEHAGHAQEALAALTATENFAEINLRRLVQATVAKSAFEPYKDMMLILIKGRHYCSLRLVNPICASINEGDCYLLITPLKVFAWIGRHANSAEKSTTTDLIDYLKQHRDFGLRNEVKYFILDQAKDDTEDDLHAEFRDILHGEIDDYKLVDDVIDDDFYETNITEFNRVYRVENDFLLPLNNFCFRSLSIKILDPNEVFVFDFGSELYVWSGKHADKTKRNMGLQLGQQLWNDFYDYSDCIINPFNPLEDKNDQLNQRPIWCIFGKQNQNVETLLFKGKFYDWPSDFQELKSLNDTTNVINKLPATQRPLSIVETLKPADVHKMLIKDDNSINLILDQINLGRGQHWYDQMEQRGHNIETLSVNVWHINDNDRHELPKTSSGQFYSDDVYIIRWKYKLIPIGLERKVDFSRDRVAYFIWQGINANLNEKGISGIMSVFLNEEKGPHVHVMQENEEAAFLQLFDGTLTIHMGKRNQLKEKKSIWRLYIFLGELDVETHWVELDASSASLRSRTSFLLINSTENLMLLWHGCGTTDEQQYLAKDSVMKLREKCPEEFHFDGQSDDIEFFEMQEGDEIELFWDGINEKNHQRKYYSLLTMRPDPTRLSTMRIFHLSSLHGPFIAQEFSYRLRSSDHVSAFPFKQSDLYELHQPALCLIDTDYELYIWQGWNDQADDDLGLQLSNANLLASGPKDLRFTAERRCAFRTAVDYYKTKTGSSIVDIPCSIVYAGLEPLDFINLFPKWTVNMKARQQNQLEGKKLYEKDSVVDILNQLCREQYTLEELRARPLPEGVDPSKIESYLSDADFQKQFNLTKDEFYALPYWKQTNIKKSLGYF